MGLTTFHHNFWLCSRKTWVVEQKLGGDGGVWNSLSDKTLLSFFSHSTLKHLVQFHFVKGALAPSKNRGHCTHPHIHWAQLSPDGHYLVPCLTALAKLFIERVWRWPWVCFMEGWILSHAVKIPLSNLTCFSVTEQLQDFIWSTSSGLGVYVCAWLGPVYIFTHEWVCLCAYVCFSKIAVSELVYL